MRLTHRPTSTLIDVTTSLSTREWQRSEDGELVEASNDEIEVRLERDARGRVVREQRGTHSVEPEYDHLGRRVGMQTSLGLRQALHPRHPLQRSRGPAWPLPPP